MNWNILSHSSDRSLNSSRTHASHEALVSTPANLRTRIASSGAIAQLIALCGGSLGILESAFDPGIPVSIYLPD
jgi:hypothetical protein